MTSTCELSPKASRPEEQLDHLRNTTCDLVQGYLFAAPLSEQQIREGLQRGTLTWPPTPGSTCSVMRPSDSFIPPLRRRDGAFFD